MGVCVKLASATYSTGEIVFYRSIIGVLFIALLARARGMPLGTSVPGAHLWRTIYGVASLALLFYSMEKLPLATAMTLNYTSSVWIGLILTGSALLTGIQRIDWRLLAAVLLGFAGVALVLRPTIEQDQLWHGLAGLLAGILAATAYLQIIALGRTGEPDMRIVFYFSVGGALTGACMTVWNGWQALDLRGAALMLAVGILATAGQLMMTRAFSLGNTLVNASLQYLVIAFSFGYGVLLFDDAIVWTALLGMVLIAGAGLTASVLGSGAHVSRAR
jgi:S-adenosylmethionine uptake transporter